MSNNYLPSDYQTFIATSRKVTTKPLLQLAVMHVGLKAKDAVKHGVRL